tara:strand:- start:87 stop:248 length:162 start_codon:yes stop_codon:yes gene_type:complete
MIDFQITIEHTSEPLAIEKELIEPLLNTDNVTGYNEKKEPLYFSSNTIIINNN